MEARFGATNIEKILESFGIDGARYQERQIRFRKIEIGASDEEFKIFTGSVAGRPLPNISYGGGMQSSRTTPVDQYHSS